MSEAGMTEAHRKILRENNVMITRDLEADQVLQRLRPTGIFSVDDEDEIKSGSTKSRRATIMLDKLPGRGENAFAHFVAALNHVHPWMGKRLAALGGIENQPIIQPLDPSGHIGMQEHHRDVLRKFSQQFCQKLDVKMMVEQLVNKGVLTDVSAEEISGERTKTAKVEKLISDALPKCGPDAFEVFYTILQSNQPQLAVDFRNEAKKIHPNIDFFQSQKSPYQETGKAAPSDGITTTNAVVPSGNTLSLSSQCSDLPPNVIQILCKALDAPANDIFDNDWTLLYKEFGLPEAKVENIRNREGSPTDHVMKTWMMMSGKQATLQVLLDCLKKCHHGELVSRIENILGVEYHEATSNEGQVVVDGMMRNMQIKLTKAPVRLIKDIPASLKKSLIEQLQAFSETDLGNMATRITQKRCYVRNASDFLEKIKENKMRFLFRELKKDTPSDTQSDTMPMVINWMRKNFPPGSTGPITAGDEVRASHMSYLHRREITRMLTASGEWKLVADYAGLSPTDISYMDQRSKEPAESVLSYWEVRSETTVGALYDLLVDSGCVAIADML